MVKVQVPAFTVATPRRVLPSYTATCSPASRVPTVPARAMVWSSEVAPEASDPVTGGTSSWTEVMAATAVGATVSTTKARVTAALALPAASLTTAESCLSPCPSAVMSAACSVYVQAPLELAVTVVCVVVLPASVRVTRAPASAVPVRALPCSAALTTSSPPTLPSTAACGASVSTVTSNKRGVSSPSLALPDWSTMRATSVFRPLCRPAASMST